MEKARPAGPSDRDQLIVLAEVARDELTDERGGRLWRHRHARQDPIGATIDTDLEAAAAGDAIVVVGTLSEVVVGYAVARRDDLGDGTEIALVTDIYVEPEARGVGLGEALMDEIVTWATAHGCSGLDAIALPGMRATKNFFERFGLTARAILVHRSLAAPNP